MQRTVRVGIYVLVLLAGGVLGYFFSRQEPKQKLLGSAREQIVPGQSFPGTRPEARIVLWARLPSSGRSMTIRIRP